MTPAPVSEWRRETRARLIARRLAAAPEQRAEWQAAIERHLTGALAEASPATIAAYWPIRGEPDPRPFALGLAASGWRVALPVLAGPRRKMIFRAWSEAAEMDEGSFGIPVPRAGEELRPDIVLLPLVGFDAANFRLGYGGGYYDRTLAGLALPPRTIGLGFELSRLATIQPQPHDIALDLVVTEAGAQTASA